MRVKFVIANVNTAAKFLRKYFALQRNVAFAIFQMLPRTKVENYDQNSFFLVIILGKKLRTGLVIG